jgi:hypothetical protein
MIALGAGFNIWQMRDRFLHRDAEPDKAWHCLCGRYQPSMPHWMWSCDALREHCRVAPTNRTEERLLAATKPWPPPPPIADDDSFKRCAALDRNLVQTTLLRADEKRFSRPMVGQAILLRRGLLPPSTEVAAVKCLVRTSPATPPKFWPSALCLRPSRTSSPHATLNTCATS